MYRTVEFKSKFPDKPEFDADGNPIVPGARELAESIAERLRHVVKSVSDIDQHEFYGWAFYTSTRDASYYNVVNPAGEVAYLTVSMDWYWIKLLALQRPKESYEGYCAILTQILKSMPEVSDVKWQEYRS